MRFLHTADWHLGRYFHGATLLDDQAHILDQLVALAISEKVDAYLVLADPSSTSGKAEKARRLGVAVITEESLVRLMGEPVVEAPAPPVLPPSSAVPVIPTN